MTAPSATAKAELVNQAALEWVVAAKKDRSLAEILLELARSHEDVMHAAARVPAERVQPGATAHRIIDACTAPHYREHGNQIRAWRAARRS